MNTNILGPHILFLTYDLRNWFTRLHKTFKTGLEELMKRWKNTIKLKVA